MAVPGTYSRGNWNLEWGWWIPPFQTPITTTTTTTVLLLPLDYHKKNQISSDDPLWRMRMMTMTMTITMTRMINRHHHHPPKHKQQFCRPHRKTAEEEEGPHSYVGRQKWKEKLNNIIIRSIYCSKACMKNSWHVHRSYSPPPHNKQKSEE